MQIEFPQEELTLLREVLEDAYRDLKEEIYHTEDTDYKRQLKGREQQFESILRKISQIEMPTRSS